MTVEESRFILQVITKKSIETQLMQAVENYFLISETIIYLWEDKRMQSIKTELKVCKQLIANSSCEPGPMSAPHLMTGFILLVKSSLNIS